MLCWILSKLALLKIIPRSFRLCSMMLPCTTHTMMRCFSCHNISEAQRGDKDYCGASNALDGAKKHQPLPGFSKGCLSEAKPDITEPILRSGLMDRQRLNTNNHNKYQPCGRTDNYGTIAKQMACVSLVVKKLC